MDGPQELNPNLSLPKPDLRPAFSGFQLNPETSKENTLHLVQRIEGIMVLAAQVPEIDRASADILEENGLWVNHHGQTALGIVSSVELAETTRIGPGKNMRIVVSAYEQPVDMSNAGYPEYEFANFPSGFPRKYDYTIRIDASPGTYYKDPEEARTIYLTPNTFGEYILNKDGEIGRMVEIVKTPEVPDPRPLLYKAVPEIVPGNPDFVAGELYPATFEALGFALQLVENRIKQQIKKPEEDLSVF